MTDMTMPIAIWLLRTLAVGSVLLLAGWLIARRLAPMPTRTVTGWGVRGAVLAAILCAAPAWVQFTLPTWSNAKAIALVDDNQPEPVLPARTAVCEEVIFKPELPTHYIAVPSSSVTIANDEWMETTTATTVSPAEFTTSPVVEAMTSFPTPAQERSVWVDIVRIVAIAYGVGVGIALLQLLLAQCSVWRIVLNASPAPGRVRELFAAACDRAQVSARLLLSSRVASPVCFGVFRPTVVIPKAFAQTAYDTELQWVFAHELDHLGRGDHRMVWWVGFARALFFPVPVFWAIRRQLSLAQEYLADAAAASVGSAAEYAEFLVSLSTGPSAVRSVRHPLTVTGVKAGRSDLYRRVTMLVATNEKTARRPSRFWQALAAGGTLSAVILLSGVGIAAEPPKPVEVAAASGDAAKADIEWIAKKDDKKASEAQAEELKAQAEALQRQAKKLEEQAKQLRAQAEAAKVAEQKAKAEGEAKEKRQAVTGTYRVIPDQSKAIDAAKAEIMEAAKKGDMKAVEAATDKLAKLKSSAVMTWQGDAKPRVLTVPAVPAVPGAPMAPVAPFGKALPLPPDAPPGARALFVPSPDAAKQAMETGMKQFKQALERVKDNPEAKAEIEKAMKAFEKAMKSMPEAFKVEGQFAPLAQLHGGVGFGDAQGFRFVEGAPAQGRFGVIVEEVSPEVVEKLKLTKGVGIKVNDVLKGSAAEKAGVKKDDILLEIESKPVPGEPADLVKLIEKIKPDEKVTIVILRDGEKKSLKDVVIPAVKMSKARVLEALPPGEGQQGLGELKMRARIIDEVDGHHKALEEELRKQIGDVERQMKKLKEEGGADVVSSSMSLSVQVNNDDITINAKQDGVKYDITSHKTDGISSIVIKDGDKTIKATKVSELPEKYRKNVEKMMKSVSVRP